MNPKELKLAVHACDMCNQVPLISGVHGIGKSDTIKQYADENDMHCEILIMSLMDVSDLIGMPRSAEIGGQHTTVWNAPSWFNRIINAAWPLELAIDDLTFNDPAFGSYVIEQTKGIATISRGDLNTMYCKFTHTPNDGLYIHHQSLVSYKHSKRSVLFVDEFNRSPADVLNASLQLILDKRLNDHVLPVINGKSTLIIAAVNPSNGDYNTLEMDPALLDRFVSFNAEAHLPSWLDWARSNNIAAVVRDFLTEHPDRLHFTAKDGKSSATPRSWASLGRTMNVIDSIAPEAQFPIMKGLIGQELAAQFLSYYNNYFKVIKMDDVEAFITKQSKKSTDIAKIAKEVNKFLKDQEVIQKSELAQQFYTKYITADNAADAKQLVIMLSSLDLEILNGFLKSKKTDDFENYMKLAKFDGKLNDKNLFKSVTTKTGATK